MVMPVLADAELVGVQIAKIVASRRRVAAVMVTATVLATFYITFTFFGASYGTRGH